MARASGALAMFLLTVLVPRAVSQGTFALLDLSSAGLQADADAWGPSLSADGRYVAFESSATNLVPGLINTGHVFVRDRLTNLTSIESISTTGKKGNLASHRPDISADGRYVVFESLSTNLVVPDLNGVADVFLRDRVLGTTELVSVSLLGAPGDGASLQASISADGRYVAFQSFATDLVAGDGNADFDVFVRDRLSATTSLVTVTPEGLFGDQGGLSPRISADGTCVAFLSTSLDLVGLPGASFPQVMLRDLQAGVTSLESASPAGEVGDSESRAVELSADGSLLVFASGAANLVVGDTNMYSDIFVRDRTSGLTLRVNVAPDGEQSDAVSGNLSDALSISAEGTRVAYESSDNFFLPDDPSGSGTYVFDVYVHDLATDVTTWVSEPAGLGGAVGASFGACLVAAGDEVAFHSASTDLVAPDGNGPAQDVFVRALSKGAWTWKGHGLAGGSGFPLLHAQGTLLAGEPVALYVQGGALSAPMLLFASVAPAPVPFKGGTLLAIPVALTVALVTDPTGALQLPFVWPSGVPSGTSFTIQAALADAGAPLGVALTNGLQGTTP